MHLFLTGSGSLAAMAVFEDKFRPDMEVRESLQFCSFKMFSSCMWDIDKLTADSSKTCTALLVGMLFGTDTIVAEKTSCLEKLHFGVAVPGPCSSLRRRQCSDFRSGLWAV